MRRKLYCLDNLTPVLMSTKEPCLVFSLGNMSKHPVGCQVFFPNDNTMTTSFATKFAVINYLDLLEATGSISESQKHVLLEQLFASMLPNYNPELDRTMLVLERFFRKLDLLSTKVSDHDRGMTTGDSWKSS